MGDVARLPVWHRTNPVCECGRHLPNFGMQTLSVTHGDASNVDIERVTFHVRCKCGRPWDLVKVINDPSGSPNRGSGSEDGQ